MYAQSPRISPLGGIEPPRATGRLICISGSLGRSRLSLAAPLTSLLARLPPLRRATSIAFPCTRHCRRDERGNPRPRAALSRFSGFTSGRRLLARRINASPLRRASHAFPPAGARPPCGHARPATLQPSRAVRSIMSSRVAVPPVNTDKEKPNEGVVRLVTYAL